jgi:UDPglucose 6-dehydrogenase
MRATVVGLGYVGLVTAACLAEWDHEVIGMDGDDRRLDELRAGRMPIHEPGLAELVQAGVEAGRLRFSASSASAVAAAQLVFVAVGTHDGDGGWQTATIRGALASIVPEMGDDSTLVVRSTLPPDFIRQLPWLVNAIRQEAGRRPIPVMTNPEFTREGTAVRDFLQPDRVVIGIGADEHGRGASALRKIYRRVDAPILVMGATDAALTKLGANLFLATKISFANELAQLCDAYGADVTQVVAGMSYDTRIGGSFLRPGIGFGGSCLPHQVTMTVRESEAIGISTPLFAAVESVNHRQRELFVERVARAVGDLAGARIALLGLTFKPDTDDLRDAPSLDIARALIDRGATVVAYDPMRQARTRAADAVPGLVVVDRAMKAIVGADAIGLVTEWPEFGSLPWGAIAKAVRRAVVIDGRNALQPAQLLAAGFEYIGFGRQARVATPDAAPELVAAAETATTNSAVERAPARPRTRRLASIETALSARTMDLGLPALGIEPNPSGA